MIDNLPNSRRYYWLIQGVLFAIIAFNAFFSQVAMLELLAGAGIVTACLRWLWLTKVSKAVISIYLLSVLPMLWFDHSLKGLLDAVSLVSASEKSQSVAAVIMFLLVAYGWVVTFWSFTKKRV
ncbi:MAG: hypothetical protein HKN57_00825 [Xanthomonadales bacterium]|nr:hypothetical protein [Gammaproteobacteria bacterium]MBT8054681.1 hypothetical protein [Gammaproteobacteria bacterium]NND55771.1 hypothetical protein [Xanthomonadales bacterium]NNK50182.1 hypothetical protein [Xanthomonadales bacterium]